MKKIYLAITLVLLLVILRLCLPYFLLKYVNKTLSRLPDYQGSVQDVDLAIIRGAYRIDQIQLDKRNGKLLQPYLKIKSVDLSVEWSALFSGKLVGEIIIENAEMNIVNDSDPKKTQVEVKGDWQDVVSDLFPIDINRLEIIESEVNYRHAGTDDEKSAELSALNGVMNGLTNKASKENSKPANFDFSGIFQDYAKLKLEGDMQPLAKSPTFDLKFTVNPLPLEKLNTLLKQVLLVDAQSGTIEAYAEVESSNGKFQGYLKPIIKDLQIVSISKDISNPIALLWEGVVEVLTQIFTNQRHDQFATKIPLEGSFKDPEIGTLSAIGELILNAYDEALKSNFEDDE